MERLCKAAVFLVVFLIATTGALHAQGLTSVTGAVKDQTGAVIPGVEVTATNAATGAARTGITNDAGAYNINQLQPGTYNIKAELPGFRPKAVSNLVLPVDQIVRQDLVLEVGNQTDVVEVSASAEAVNTENAQLGVGFQSKQILDLPLNARNIVGLLSLQSGVSVDTGDATTSGFVNGARNDQQNIVLDGVDMNRQQGGATATGAASTAASPFTGALPTTLDSVQEFIVQTSGQSAAASRSSGAQVQLVTKSGSNEFHGSAYEAYRSKVTTATPYFNGQATPKPGLIRNIPGGSIGGPILKNKLFFFGAFERHTDRSQTTVTRSVPTPTYLAGQIRYLRKPAAVAKDGILYGTITTGCGGMLEQITQVSCDTVNPALFGANGYLQQYAKYTASGQTVCPNDCSNLTNFTFNAPNIVNQNVYISRFDYTINSKNTVYVRGTLNNAATLGSPTFPDLPNALTTYDNSKGFSTSLNSVLSSTLNNNLTVGLTRQDGNTTGAAAVAYSFGPASLFQTAGANRQAINTWNIVDNLSWVRGNHNWTFGGNFSFVDNYTLSYSTASPGNFSEAANILSGDIGTTGAVTLGRALGATELANVSSAQTLGDAVTRAIGGLNQYTVGVQFDTKGNLLPAGSPFLRTIRMNQYDFYAQDSWKVKPNFTLNYGLHWGVMTPPWEKNGLEVNWTQNLGDRYNIQKSTPFTDDQLPLLSTQLAGRANNLPDFYAMAKDNWAPRASFAYTPGFTDGILGTIAHKGGQMVLRGGYALSFDHTGGRLATDATVSGGIGLLTSFTAVAQSFSIDGNGKPAVPRVGGSGAGLVLPYSSFPVAASQSFIPASSAGGWGGPRGLQGIDPGMRPPSNHLLNFTVSKELPGGLVVEASYVGRFARGLLGVLDLANPVNVVDSQSGQDYYGAIKQLFEMYEYNRVGGPTAITAANAATAVAGIAPLPWFEHVYSGFQNWAQTSTDTAAFKGVTFQNATQAFYAVLNKGFIPGPNAQVTLTNATNFYESDTSQHITTNGQAQYLPLYKNFGWSNYNSGQFSVRKRFSAGYTVTANYTWSKSLDLTSQGEAAGQRPGGSGSPDQLIDPYHPELNYGRSTFDRRGQFNGNFTAELPFGSGKLIGGNMGHALNQVFGGWSASAIIVADSGLPFNFVAGNRFTFHFNGSDIPIPTAPIAFSLSHGSNPAGNVPTAFWITDQSASASCDSVCTSQNRVATAGKFRTPYPGGAVVRNWATGPRFFNADASLTKAIKVSEKMNGQFRAEAFNVLNHPNFSNPSGTNIDGTASLLGQITTIVGANRIMQFTVRLQF